MQRDRQPRRRHDRLPPPLRINLLVLLHIHALLLRRPSRALDLLELCLARQTHKVARHAGQPGAIRPQIDFGGLAAGAGGPAGRGRGREHLGVDQIADVFEELKGEIEQTLGHGGGVEDRVLAGFGPAQELAGPGVEREESEEAERGAGLRDDAAEGEDARGAAAGRGPAEELGEFDAEGNGFGFGKGEEVEGVVEGRKERAETAGSREEPVRMEGQMVGSVV